MSLINVCMKILKNEFIVLELISHRRKEEKIEIIIENKSGKHSDKYLKWFFLVDKHRMSDIKLLKL